MQRASFPKLLLAFLSLFFCACAHGPQVPVYISNPEKGGMDWANQKDGGFVPYVKTDKFICLAPADAQTLLNYCGAPQSK